jgi:O-methyltransferase
MNLEGLKNKLKCTITNDYNKITSLSLVSKERFDNIDYIAKILETDNIKGDIVETGIWRGGMVAYLSQIFPNRKIYGCDSFEGCQNPKDGKYIVAGETHNYGKYYGGTLDDVKENLNSLNIDYSNIIFIKGWFRDTMINFPSDKIALLRLDGDSYSATLEVLDELYCKVVKGGFVIIDDYMIPECRAALNKFLENKKNIMLLSPNDNLPLHGRIEHGIYWRKME